MKHLLLLRHADAESARLGENDRERSLTPAGRDAAAAVGGWLARCGVAPDLVLCSSARRALETLDEIRARLDPELPVHREDLLYQAGREAMIERITLVREPAAAVVLVGHNPTIAEATHALVADGEPEALERLRAGFPAGSVAHLELPVPLWREAGTGGGRLRAFVRPRDLG